MLKVVDGSRSMIDVVREEIQKRPYLASMDRLDVDEKILSLETDEKFDLFMLIGTLEQVKDTDALSEKIKSLAGDVYHIIGNIPLHTNGHFKRNMDVDILNEDMAKMGCTQITQYVYGVNGWPYLFWEATNV